MSKHTINHICGHSVGKELFGRHRDRDSKIEWLERQPCLDCLREEEKQKREAQNQAAAAANRLAGYLPLAGTEKQIAWAESIRRDAINIFTDLSSDVPDAAKTVWAQTSEWLKNQSEAKWWIETVGTLLSREGLAPLHAMISGRPIKASPREILRALLILLPYLTEGAAKALGIEREFRDAVSLRLKADVRAEAKSRKPRPPAFIFAGAPAGAKWNGKIYSGRRIFVGGAEIRMTVEQESDVKIYLSAMAAWSKELEALA